MSSRIVRDYDKKKGQRNRDGKRNRKRKEGVGRTNGIVQWVRILATKDRQHGSVPGILVVEGKN